MTARIVLSFLGLALGGEDKPSQTERPSAEKTQTVEFVLYEDDSWTHIGDGRFSPQSNGFSDLTLKTSGKELAVTIALDAKTIAEIAKPKWKSAVLTGSVIGNDTGTHGNTSPTIISLDGKPIGEISKSGLFRVSFDKQRLSGDPKKAMKLTITAGQNSAADLDDQELGTFKLLLSTNPPPKPKKGTNSDQPADSVDD